MSLRQHILITGATTGIGRACALLLAEGGAAIWINHHGQTEQARKWVEHIGSKGGQARAVEADVSRSDEVAGMFATVTAAVAFLLSPAASFFTGQILGPNGGFWMGG